MKSERNQQIDQVFQAALARDVAARSRFLDEACATDPGLRREVESLLAADEQASDFIESPALEIAPEIVAGDRTATVSGKTIGPYRLDQRLGAGGMGKVYLAHDIRLGRKVALKLLDPRLLDDTEQRTRFLREARLASVLDHPNICTIHQVGEAAGRLFIAMQYVDGKTLKQMIDGRPLSLDCLLSISLQVADALAVAHAQGIIHRDIKAGNIIITPRGQAKVLDFGLAKLMERAEEEADNDLTITGAIMGTPSSMSPEQARGERTDHRSDVFSFGVVMYEMATGRAPFNGKTRADIIDSLLNQPHPPAVEVNKRVPAKLSAVIDNALAKEPSERYQSAQEMIADLRHVVAEAGGTDQLFSSSPAQLRMMTAYAAPRQRRSIKLFGRKIETQGAVALLAIVAVLLAGLALLIYRSWPRQSPLATQNKSVLSPAATSIKSIAVLPFKPLAEKSRDEVLEIGMADTLINRLSGMKDVVVRPISAVRKYAGLEQDAVTAGQEQRVEAVLDGSIYKSGDRVRVTVRLVKVADGSQLWGETFNEKFTDIFAVQDRVSERVAGLLAVKLTGQEQILLTKRHTENPEAYQLYLKGRYFWNQRTDQGLKKAIEYFEQAIEIDPQYALAYVGLADSHSGRVIFSSALPDEDFPKAKAAVLKALEIDETLAEAHAVLGIIKIYYEWDWAGAEKECKRAIELNPNNAAAHTRYGEYLVRAGRFDEAIAEFRAGQRLDPLSLMMHTQEGVTLIFARRYDEAIEKLRKTLEMDPNFLWAHVFLGETLAAKGMYEEAISEYQKAAIANGASLEDAARVGAAMRAAYAASGARGYHRWWIDRFTERAKGRPIHNYDRARRYALLGENDQTLAWLEKAYRYKDPQLVRLKIDAEFDGLRTDPRFQDLLRRMGFAP